MALPNPEAFAAILLRGRSALAWEVLRRDPAYRSAYARLSAPPKAGIAAEPAFVADWGLHFP
jgi:hypothetical protein